MPRETKVTYQIVKNAAMDLERQGVSPTNEMVRSRTGGSAAIVAGLLKRWREEKRKSETLMTYTLDEGIKVAIIDEINRHVEAHTNNLREELKYHEGTCEDLKNELTNSEAQREDLQSQVQKRDEALHQERIAVEKEKGRTETIIESLKEKCSELQGDLKASYQKVSDLEKNVSKLEEKNSGLSQQLLSQLSELDSLKSLLLNAEKKAAVAEALNKKK